MTTAIISKQLYFHPLSDKGFASQSAANKAYKIALRKKKKEEGETARFQQAEKRKEELENYVRLSVESIEDILPMLIQNIKDIFGFDFDLKISGLHFGNVSNSHSAPIGKKTNWGQREKGEPNSYLGWEGAISGKYAKIKGDNDKSISDCCGSWAYNNKIRGFHTGGGGGGSNGWSYRFGFFLQDFPKLAAKYKKYSKYKAKLNEEKQEVADAKDEWYRKNEEVYFAKPKVVENLERIADLHEEILRLKKSNDEIKEGVFNENPFKYATKFSDEELQKLNVGFE